MKKIVQALIIWMPLVLGACKKDPGYHVEEYQEVKVDDLPDDVKIPSKAWGLLEFKTTGEESPSATKNIIFSEVNVYLVEKNPGVIQGEAVKISLPKGGGTIDLSRFVNEQRGSFYVGMEFPEFQEATGKKVFFISRARKRKIGAQVFGAGCNQFFDITDRFFKEMAVEGIRVNTTKDRHLSVLGGTFLFAAQKNNDVHVAQVTFTSSQQTALFCEEH